MSLLLLFRRVVAVVLPSQPARLTVSDRARIAVAVSDVRRTQVAASDAARFRVALADEPAP